MRHIHRTRRDWATDLGLVLFSALFAAVSSQSIPVVETLDPRWRTADQMAGGLACAAVLLRRRWPVPLAVVLILAGTQAHYLTGPAVVAVFTVAATRPWRATAWVAALIFAPLPVFLWQLPDMPEERAGPAVTYFALLAGAIGWGLFRRSREQLIGSLRARAELAEADAESRAERARMEAREEIAREMHDVLGHRLSLLSVHAGALEFNPGAPRAEIERAAGVMRESAHLALRDLREVIGVLRAGSGTGEDERPQPELPDLARLVEEARAAGDRIELTGPPDGTAPALAGRTAYRIVQEALTNVRKHAPGAAVDVRVAGGPGEGLTVEIANARPPGAPTGGPGDSTDGGQGLIGLAERARLAGGELTALPVDGGFRVRAWLPWQG
ncbi:sensor histidine kinase [Streptomyces bambusae]|uniref:histidine kinase n=1 Tax=Streptomyces bambusae TaxID=1550616 RepID=A0ABS6ZD66_9ACTN|nr:histidine kinase [Streptomyces bambusae]MBW5485163.1 two-component sensor histidine kinase [Streptomyces bambusae]